MGYVNDEDEAKDLVQETFISAWKSLPGFRNQSSVGTWIFRIAANHCLRRLEIGRRHRAEKLSPDWPEVPAQHTAEKIQVLYQCIGKLKETERIIISLVLEDLPSEEIAQITGISDGNLRVKIHRIKEKLAKIFKDHERL